MGLVLRLGFRVRVQHETIVIEKPHFVHRCTFNKARGGLSRHRPIQTPRVLAVGLRLTGDMLAQPVVCRDASLRWESARATHLHAISGRQSINAVTDARLVFLYGLLKCLHGRMYS